VKNAAEAQRRGADNLKNRIPKDLPDDRAWKAYDVIVQKRGRDRMNWRACLLLFSSVGAASLGGCTDRAEPTPPGQVTRPVPPSTSSGHAAANPDVSSDARIVGKTVEEALKALRLTLDEHFVINEPPGIARGVKGKEANGDEVWLYVSRSKPGFRENMQWTIEDFSKQATIGVARKAGKSWTTYGEVIRYYHR